MKPLFLVLDLGAVVLMSLSARYWSEWNNAPILLVLGIILYVNAKTQLAKNY